MWTDPGAYSPEQSTVAVARSGEELIDEVSNVQGRGTLARATAGAMTESDSAVVEMTITWTRRFNWRFSLSVAPVGFPGSESRLAASASLASPA
jgi:hypothetical protein